MMKHWIGSFLNKSRNKYKYVYLPKDEKWDIIDEKGGLG